MTIKEIIRGNELLGKFMGAQKCDRCEEDCGGYEFVNNGPVFTPEEMNYHKSWDWLMRVAEKINKMDDGSFYISIEPYETTIKYYEHDDGYEKLLISAHHTQIGKKDQYIKITWKAMVDFVIWYNKKNNL